MAAKQIIFLLVALLAVFGLASASPVNETALISHGETQEKQTERNLRSVDDMDDGYDILSLMMAQAFLQSEESTENDMAFAQTDFCNGKSGLTRDELQNIINTVASGTIKTKGGYVHDTYLTTDFGQTVYVSGYSKHAEEHFMDDWMNNNWYPREIWLSKSPCWRQCAGALMKFYKKKAKPTIYFAHLHIGNDQKYSVQLARENAIDCLAVMTLDGFNFKPWSWVIFQRNMKSKGCSQDIDYAYSVNLSKPNYGSKKISSKFEQRMQRTSADIREVYERASQYPPPVCHWA